MIRGATAVCTIGMFSNRFLVPLFLCKSTSLPLFLAVSRGLFGPFWALEPSASATPQCLSTLHHSSRLRPLYLRHPHLQLISTLNNFLEY
jgi:hypothetical protein